MKKESWRKYEDIIHLSRPVSRTHPPMPLSDRAAQFAPFAALTGHGDAMKETARYTKTRPELTEDMKAALDLKLRALLKEIHHHPKAEITYFVPDERKDGGAYETCRGRVRRILPDRRMVLEEGTVIPVDDILELTLLQ